MSTRENIRLIARTPLVNFLVILTCFLRMISDEFCVVFSFKPVHDICK